jgi:hypothetical protein
MGRVSRDARLLFVLMWTLADDSGRLRGNSRILASLLFPYDDDAPIKISEWVDELAAENCITIYTIDQSTFIEIRKWLSHQKIDRPSPSKIPPPRESSRAFANPREGSAWDQDQDQDQGSRTKDQILSVAAIAASPRKAERKKQALEILIPESLGPDFHPVWIRWIAHRKEIKKPLTKTQAESQLAKFAEWGFDRAKAAIEHTILKGWQGIQEPGENSQVVRRRYEITNEI